MIDTVSSAPAMDDDQPSRPQAVAKTCNLYGLAMEPVKRLARRMIQWALDSPLPPESDQDRELAEELRETFRGFPAIDTAVESPAERAWTEYSNRLRESVLNADIREFLRWDVILNTMFVARGAFLRKELAYLVGRSDWDTRWKPAIRESAVGHPIPCRFGPSTSGNLIHHAYHLARFEAETGRSVSDMSAVLEFGGGYGSMCRLFHQLGFRGRYLIQDLPPFSALQRFYLRRLGLDVRAEDAPSTANGIECVATLDDLRRRMEGVDVEHGLFIATWSLSESPLGVRREVLPISERFGAHLIAFQDRFREIDNVEFFNRWQVELPTLRWQTSQIEHLQGHRYLFGTQRGAGLG